jgi:hypothetical protein
MEQIIQLLLNTNILLIILTLHHNLFKPMNIHKIISEFIDGIQHDFVMIDLEVIHFCFILTLDFLLECDLGISRRNFPLFGRSLPKLIL